MWCQEISMIKTSTYLLFKIAMNGGYSVVTVWCETDPSCSLTNWWACRLWFSMRISTLQQLILCKFWFWQSGYSLLATFSHCMGCLVCLVKSYHVLINMEWGFYICSVFAVHTHGLGVFITFAIWMVAYMMTKLNSVSRTAWRLLLNTGQMRYILSPVFTVYKHYFVNWTAEVLYGSLMLFWRHYSHWQFFCPLWVARTSRKSRN